MNTISRIPTRLTRQDSRRKYQAIMDAAGALFTERGFAATGMDAVSLQSGVSKRTVYSHFESKEALFAAVVELLCARVLQAEPSELNGCDGTPAEVLTLLGTSFLLSIYGPEQMALYQTVVADSRQFPEIGRMMFEGPVLRSQSIVSACLRQLTDRGLLRLSSPDLAAAHFIGMLKTDVHMRLMFSQPPAITRPEIARIAACTVELFLHGALPRPGQPGATESSSRDG